MSENLKLRINRIIKAKRQRVFEAWTNPELLKQWIAPFALTCSFASTDPKVGGTYRFDMQGHMQGRDVDGSASGIYQKVIPNELLVFTWSWGGKKVRNEMKDTLVTVEFRDVDGGTEITLTHEKFVTDEFRNNYQHGWLDTFEKLTDLVAA